MCIWKRLLWYLNVADLVNIGLLVVQMRGGGLVLLIWQFRLIIVASIRSVKGEDLIVPKNVLASRCKITYCSCRQTFPPSLLLFPRHPRPVWYLLIQREESGRTEGDNRIPYC